MAIAATDVEKIAHLARLMVSPEEAVHYAQQLSAILDLVAQMDQVDTDGVSAITHATEEPQRKRPDIVTETSQRETFQALAPAVEAGLYLVPKVIETESA